MAFNPLDPESLLQDMKNHLLEAYASTGTIKEACEIAGVPTRTAYSWRKSDEKFRDEWDHITKTEVLALLEQKAIERANDKSDILLMFLLKAYNRKLYDDKAANEKEDKEDKGIQLVFQEVKSETVVPHPAGADGPPQKS